MVGPVLGLWAAFGSLATQRLTPLHRSALICPNPAQEAWSSLLGVWALLGSPGTRVSIKYGSHSPSSLAPNALYPVSTPHALFKSTQSTGAEQPKEPRAAARCEQARRRLCQGLKSPRGSRDLSSRSSTGDTGASRAEPAAARGQESRGQTEDRLPKTRRKQGRVMAVKALAI